MRPMRRTALALVATGCNWTFGLDPTVLAPPPDAPPGVPTTLQWAIATSDGMGSPDPVIVFAPIGSEAARPELPVIRIGHVPGDGASSADLAPVAYDATTGRFEVPYELRLSPHRIEVQLPHEPYAHEWQWTAAGAKLVFPRTTRLDAPIPPAGSGYRITPSGLTGPLDTARAYHIGANTLDMGAALEWSGAEMTFRYANVASPLAGPLGAPSPVAGDFLLVADWSARSAYQSSITGWFVELAAAELSAPSTPPEFVREAAHTRTLSTLSCPGVDCLPAIGAGAARQRIVDKLGALAPEPIRGGLVYGVSPSTQLPGFTPGHAPRYAGDPFQYSEVPLMLPFAESLNHDSTITLFDPAKELALPLERVLVGSVRGARVVGGIELVTTMQTMTTQFGNSVGFPAPLALGITLDAIDLSGTGSDGASVARPADYATLAWTDETGDVTSQADEHIVALYEITGTTLTLRRLFHVMAPAVKLTPDLLEAGHAYVFAVTSRVGLPDARSLPNQV